MRRYFAAVHNGAVIGVRETQRQYTHAVVHVGRNGVWATFHSSAQHAHDSGLEAFRTAPTKLVVPVLETTRLLRVGDAFDPATVKGAIS